MARLIELKANKTYATYENAVKAVEKKIPADQLMDQTYFIHRDRETGRYFPVFLGERALRHGLHFHFNVAG